MTFDCDGTIVVGTTIIINQDTVLSGAGRAITISGGNQVRIFQVNTAVTFTVEAMALNDGRHSGENGSSGAPGGDGFGAGILNLGGTINLVHCSLANHVAQGGSGTSTSRAGQGRGAAICNIGGSVNLTNCSVAGCCAKGGSVPVGSDFSAPNVPGGASGAAVYAEGGNVSAQGCQFVKNRVIGADAPFNNFAPIPQGGAAQGGAIFATSSVLHVSFSLFQSNTAAGGLSPWNTGVGQGGGGPARGGAVSLSSGEAWISDSGFLSNSVLGGDGVRYSAGGEASGGAIDSAGILRVRNARFSQNQAEGGKSYWAGAGLGGAISSREHLILEACAIDNNLARGGPGDTADILVGPGASGNGGAIYSEADLAATNVSIFGNRAIGGAGSYSFFSRNYSSGGPGQGGAICAATGSVALALVTAFSNAAQGGVEGYVVQTNHGPAQGGGIAVLGGTSTLVNSIVASNAAGNCFGQLSDGGHNLSSDSSCPFTAPGSLNNTDARLGPFGDYGGPTPTLPLLAGSPAIDAASPGSCAPFDQRGIPRPFGAGCDIGAFESAPPYTLRGHVNGFLSTVGTSVSVGSLVAKVDDAGSFGVNGLSAGDYQVTPAAPDSVFVLSNRVFHLGPDIVDADFQSYRSNAWTIVSTTNGVLRLVLAGAAGEAYRAFDSGNLNQWQLLSNSLMHAGGVWEFHLSLIEGAHFFKASSP